MACGSCTKRRTSSVNNDSNSKDALAYALVFGNNAYLTDRQLKARLENYKRNYCKDCSKRYDCALTDFIECKNIKK